MDKAWGAKATERMRGSLGLRSVIAGNARVESLAGAHSVLKRGHGFFNGGLRVGTVGVENVHVVKLHALEALVQASKKIFARAPVAIRPRPHIPAGLGANDEFVAVGGELAMKDAAEILLSGNGRRTVVVCKVEVGDAEVEGTPEHGLTILKGIHVAKIVPKAERDGGQKQSTSAAAAVLHFVVTRLRGRVTHMLFYRLLKKNDRRGAFRHKPLAEINVTLL